MILLHIFVCWFLNNFSIICSESWRLLASIPLKFNKFQIHKFRPQEMPEQYWKIIQKSAENEPKVMIIIHCPYPIEQLKRIEYFSGVVSADIIVINITIKCKKILPSSQRETEIYVGESAAEILLYDCGDHFSVIMCWECQSQWWKFHSHKICKNHHHDCNYENKAYLFCMPLSRLNNLP